MSVTTTRAEFNASLRQRASDFNARLHIIRNASKTGKDAFPVTTMGVRMTEAAANQKGK